MPLSLAENAFGRFMPARPDPRVDNAFIGIGDIGSSNSTGRPVSHVKSVRCGAGYTYARRASRASSIVSFNISATASASVRKPSWPSFDSSTRNRSQPGRPSASSC